MGFVQHKSKRMKLSSSEPVTISITKNKSNGSASMVFSFSSSLVKELGWVYGDRLAVLFGTDDDFGMLRIERRNDEVEGVFRLTGNGASGHKGKEPTKRTTISIITNKTQVQSVFPIRGNNWMNAKCLSPEHIVEDDALTIIGQPLGIKSGR